MATLTFEGVMETNIKYGVCKECYFDIPLIKDNKLFEYDIWECPICGYPNAISDFWQIYIDNKSLVKPDETAKV